MSPQHFRNNLDEHNRLDSENWAQYQQAKFSITTHTVQKRMIASYIVTTAMNVIYAMANAENWREESRGERERERAHYHCLLYGSIV